MDRFRGRSAVLLLPPAARAGATPRGTVVRDTRFRAHESSPRIPAPRTTTVLRGLSHSALRLRRHGRLIWITARSGLGRELDFRLKCRLRLSSWPQRRQEPRAIRCPFRRHPGGTFRRIAPRSECTSALGSVPERERISAQRACPAPDRERQRGSAYAKMRADGGPGIHRIPVQRRSP